MSFHQDFQHRSVLTSSAKVVPKVNTVFRTPTITKRTPAFTSTDNTGTHDLSLFTSQPPRGPFPGFDWSSIDGSKFPAGGSAQIPSLLNGYFSRPPWQVAGVDYAVGPHPGTGTTDFEFAGSLVTALSNLGGSLGANNVLSFSNSVPITIDGYDFSLHGGVALDFSSTAPVTLQNCKFAVGANTRGAIQATGSGNTDLTIRYCSFDGSKIDSTSSSSAFISLRASNNLIFEYNFIFNTYDQHMQVGVDPTSNSTVLYRARYNLLRNGGWGSQFGAHGDWMQIFSANAGNPTFNDCQIGFNTFVQDDSSTTDKLATQGVSLSTGGNTAIYLNENIFNNTIVLPVPQTSTINVNNAFIIDASQLNGSASVTQNYFDPSGLKTFGSNPASWINVERVSNGQGTGPFNGTVIRTGNINMLDGSLLTNTQ